MNNYSIDSLVSSIADLGSIKISIQNETVQSKQVAEITQENSNLLQTLSTMNGHILPSTTSTFFCNLEGASALERTTKEWSSVHIAAMNDRVVRSLLDILEPLSKLRELGWYSTCVLFVFFCDIRLLRYWFDLPRQNRDDLPTSNLEELVLGMM